MVCYYNLSTIPECVVLSGSDAIDQIVDVVTRDCTVLTCQLCVGFLCNISNTEVFQEELSLPGPVQAIIQIIASPQLHMSIKVDAVQTVYNMVTMYPACRVVFIENDVVTALWKFLKAQGGGGGGGGKDDASTTALSSNASSSVNTASADASDDEDSVLLLIGQIVEALCSQLEDPKIHRKAMADGIMNVILKLAKLELPSLKANMSFCMYNMIKGGDLMKVLKWESVDILFWLTLYDTLGLQDLILRNVARTLRGFSAGAEESKVLIRQERFFSVFKELIKSKNEDVLWQSAGVLYNLLQYSFNIKVLLDKGLIGYIFEIAQSGFESVRHVCSACLHLVPNDMPDMDDPVVLELVLCLLEAQGDKFAQLSDPPTDIVQTTSIEKYYAGSKLKVMGTDFKASWGVIVNGLESVFTPAMLFVSDEHTDFDNTVMKSGTATSAEASSFGFHQKITSDTYAGFQASNETARDGDPSDGLSIVTPNLQARIPAVGSSGNSPVGDPLSMDSPISRPAAGHTKSVHQKRDRERDKELCNISIFSTNSSRLPLIQPPKDIPTNTLAAIKSSTYKNKSGQNPPTSKRHDGGAGLPPAVMKSYSDRNSATMSINSHMNSSK